MTHDDVDAIDIIKKARDARLRVLRDQNVDLATVVLTRENFDKVVSYATQFLTHGVGNKSGASFVSIDGIRFEADA